MFGKKFFLAALRRHLPALILLAVPVSAPAAPPTWWSQTGADGHTVIDSAVTNVDPKGVANVGQAKYMAKRALDALRAVDPSAATAVETDLVGAGKIIPAWGVPPAGSDLAKAQYAPLLVGQLKAMAAPFYNTLHTTAPDWLDHESAVEAEKGQLQLNGTKDPVDSGNFYPWTAVTSDDANKAMATLGQLKAVFSLRFETLPPPPPANTAPAFATNPISLNATADTALVGQLAATDPDAGDTLTYTKVFGPTWLTVSGTGALGGTPTTVELGSNVFIVRVTDGSDAYGEADLIVTVASDNQDPDLDLDGDGLTNGQEALLGTDPDKIDTDGDGVTDGDEHKVSFTNPLSAADDDNDSIADDLEKHLSLQLLAFQPEPAEWGDFHVGLAAGNLDPTHDYTGEGLTAADLAALVRSSPKSVSLKDGLALIEKGPIPRYALFPITNAQPPTGWEEPWQISDMGTVLYNNGTWTGGVWTPLLLESGNLKNCLARSINDHNVILGSGTLNVQVGTQSVDQLRVCHWTAPDASPAALSATAAEGEVFPSTSYDLSYGKLRYGQVLSNDGKFLQPTHRADGLQYPYLRPSLWTLPSGTNSATEISADDGLRYNQENGLQWGFKMPPANEHGAPDWTLPLKGAVYAPPPLPELPFNARNVVALETTGLVVALPYPDETGAGGMPLVNGRWLTGTMYDNAVDVSKDRAAIGKPTESIKRPSCSTANGRTSRRRLHLYRHLGMTPP